MEIELCGYKVLIDDDDFEIINQYKWHTNKKLAEIGSIYFYHHFYTNGVRSTVRLHNFIFGYKKNKIVDHINCNTLDNRKCNLRFVTIQQNQMNRKKQSNNKSGYKGVDWDNGMHKWRARIQYKNKQIVLGFFTSIEDAYKSYCEASKKYHGKYGRIA